MDGSSYNVDYMTS